MFSRRLPRLFSVVLLATLPFAACECDTVAAIPEPNIEVADEAGNRHTEADPWLAVAFGDVDDGSTKVHTLTLRNVGGARLEIANACLVNASSEEEALAESAPCVQISGTPFSFPNVAGEVVQPAAELALPITFAPVDGGPAQFFLRIQSNAVIDPVVAVELTGRGTAGRLCADNPVLDFGNVYVGESQTMQVTLENCGLRPVTIDSYALTTNPDDVFSVQLDGAAPAAPIGPLEPGESITLDVTFTPPQVRSYRDTLAGQATLTTAAPFVAGYTLLFVGDGRNPPSCRVNVVPQTVQFGAVASTTTATQQLIIQSVGECACEVTSLEGPVPADTGFAMPTPPTLPMILKGTQGCEGDPEGAQDQSNLLIVDLEYTSPDRETPTVDNATMTVTTTDATEPVRDVSLEANGGGAPFCQLEVTPVGGGSLGGLIPAEGRYGVVEFGRVTVHFTKKLPILLKNIGNTTCTIDGVNWDEEANTLANEFGLEYEDGTPVNVGGVSPISLNPSEEQRFMAVFSPTHVLESNGVFDVFSFGSYSASKGGFGCGFLEPNSRCNGVSFTTSDTVTTGDGVTNGEFSIGFSATPVEPAIDVIPGDIDFGLVTLDCGSPMRRVNVYNTGSGDLTVGQPYATPDTAPLPTFEVASNAPSFPHVIPAGGTMAVDVRFYARTLSVVTGELIIPTFEGGEEGPPVSVPLRGEGTLETEQTDVFDQFTDPKVDVLWVVDDSGSMAPYQQLLADNFPQFFVESDVSAADYHIAVTTTLALDGNCIPDLSGNTSCADDPMAGYYTACSGNDRFLTVASSDPSGQFVCNVQVSEPGHLNPSRPASDAAEAGLQAARSFLSPPKIDDPAINGGFMREDAKLHVIIVSDEPDFSKGPVDLYVDFFRNLKGFRNDSLVAVSAIAGPPQGCSWQDSGGNTVTVGADPRYSEAVAALNGRFQSICESDWTTTMSNLGLASLGLKVEFFLSRAADAATLTVCVRDGSPSATCNVVSQTSDGAANGYFYDPTANSIVFNPASVPSRGSRVEVHYETFCY